MTREELEMWLRHPVTKEVLNVVSRAISSRKEENTVAVDSIDATVIRTALNQGFIEGASIVDGLIDEVLDR